ncbi:MAG: TPM domain-containing protein [Bacteroidetes bacterium]|nr:TPM domain-containing protein [Bacteroidota bacterium]
MRLAKDSFRLTVDGWRLVAPSFRRKRLLILFFIISSHLLVFSLPDYPAKPNPPRLVNDFAGMLSASESQALESKLVAYDDSTSTQISIVIINTLDGMDKAQYATELGEKWGIGGAKFDNGVLILVSKSDRQLFIATGRGVEEYLPDAICKRIIERVIKPSFGEGNYYNGLNAATDEMIARMSGVFVNTDTDGDAKQLPLWAIILIFVIIIIVIFFISKNNNGGTSYGRRGWGGGPFLGGGGFGGGGFGGGGGGGGFGGFGGGGFGGGGAGGSW